MQVSPLEAALTSLRLTSGRERVAIALGACLALALVGAMIAQGRNVEAHISATSWVCGKTLKGSPTCMPDRVQSAP
jgi:hypothetical protein